MRYYFVVGEASGDLHAAALIDALRLREPQAQIRAMGGDLMQEAGAELASHYRELSFMGLGQVLKNIFRILGHFRFCKRDIEAFAPDVLVLIDYSGFNLRLASWAKKKGYRIVYYIAPQLWATRPGRLKTLRKTVDELLVILPFEPGFYAQHAYNANYVGHPLLDRIEPLKQVSAPKLNLPTKGNKPLVALLPGSRKQEIRAMLPLMLQLTKSFPQYQFVLAAAPGQSLDFYHSFLQGYDEVAVLQGKTYDLLGQSQLALVSSGTATLETALWQVPQIVCYKTSAFFYYLVKSLIRIPYISLVNLILGREAIPELIQGKFSLEELQKHFQELIDPKSPKRQAMLQAYTELRSKLGPSGASARAAERVLYWAKQKELGKNE